MLLETTSWSQVEIYLGWLHLRGFARRRRDCEQIFLIECGRTTQETLSKAVTVISLWVDIKVETSWKNLLSKIYKNSRKLSQHFLRGIKWSLNLSCSNRKLLASQLQIVVGTHSWQLVLMCNFVFVTKVMLVYQDGCTRLS